MSTKKMLILVGPQGSGNHIFARLFSMHPKVKGWEELKNNYWVKHQRDELAEYWIFPQLLKQSYFESHDFFVTDVSYPVNFDGMRYNPKIMEFAQRVKGWGIDIQFGVITRDEGINKLQQERIRAGATLDTAKNYIIENILNGEFPVHFLSMETFFAYKIEYLKHLEKLMKFPIGFDQSEILKFIDESPNQKYLKYVETYWLDEHSTVGKTLDDLSVGKESDD